MNRRRKIGFGVVVGVVLLWGAVRFLFEGWYVNGVAMEPTYRHGDLLLGYKLAYWKPTDVRRGDVVVVRHSPRGFDEHQVWRVQGLPGEAFQYPDGSQGTLGDAQYFMSGDNPEGSLDSSTFGTVPFARIQFKIVGRLLGVASGGPS